jgi:Cu-Zn family superoxide dismutase
MEDTMKNFLTPLALAAFSLALAQPAAPGNAALVRAAHLSPNAEGVSITLTGTGEGVQQLAPEPLSDLAYRDTTDYLEVPAGEYDVAVQTQGGTLQETLTLSPGLRYTVAAIGLVIPEELGQQAEDEGGFFDFLGDLFTDEENRSALALRLVTFEDDVVANAPGLNPGLLAPRAPLTPANRNTATGGAMTGGTMTGGADVAGQERQFSYVRLVHAAPGTAPVTLESSAAAGDQEPTAFVSDLAFGEASGFTPFNQADVGNLEVSLQGSEAGALTLGLENVSLEPGSAHTLFVIGTPTNEAPLEVLSVSSPLSPQGGAATGGAMTGGAGQQAGSEATAQIQDTEGNQVGNATFTTTQDGAVEVQVQLSNFSAASEGEHGIHIHQVGQCEPPFESAGDHYNPTGAEHGFLSPAGSHAGDLPNIRVDGDGNANYTATTGLVTLQQGERSLADQDGSALLIHSNPDDYRSNPSGGSGDPIACGVITQGQGGGQ